MTTTIILSTTIKTPIGSMYACATNEGICMLEFPYRKSFLKQVNGLKRLLNADIMEGESKYFEMLKSQLKEYFKNQRKDFEIPLVLSGSAFQLKVWNELRKIPYGERRTYLQQSKNLDSPKAIRAVAAANGANKISILIPCHRVVGSNGSLIGYGGGIRNKQFLLELESKNNSKQTRLDF